MVKKGRSQPGLFGTINPLRFQWKEDWSQRTQPVWWQYQLWCKRQEGRQHTTRLVRQLQSPRCQWQKNRLQWSWLVWFLPSQRQKVNGPLVFALIKKDLPPWTYCAIINRLYAGFVNEKWMMVYFCEFIPPLMHRLVRNTHKTGIHLNAGFLFMPFEITACANRTKPVCWFWYTLQKRKIL